MRTQTQSHGLRTPRVLVRRLRVIIKLKKYIITTSNSCEIEDFVRVSSQASLRGTPRSRALTARDSQGIRIQTTNSSTSLIIKVQGMFRWQKRNVQKCTFVFLVRLVSSNANATGSQLGWRQRHHRHRPPTSRATAADLSGRGDP